MCGIFTFVGNIDEQQAFRCTRRLRHRGPDHIGVKRLDGVTLGHTRLSILDLSEAGRQPMSFGGGRWWTTYNGEIYNYREIRKELESIGVRFHSQTDTEVFLAAFVQWGWACMDKFNGMWAFAIWDTRDRTLHFARDRFGKKPLFYTQTPDGFAIASEMKALLPVLPEVAPNGELVRDSSRIVRYEATGETLIKGIRRLPAGHYGEFSDKGLAVRKWWDTLDHLVDAPDRYEDQVALFRDLFFDACRLRLQSDVPVGTALSGGLDSSAVTAVVNDLNGRGVCKEGARKAFVASFPGTPFDETEYALTTANFIGVDVEVVSIDPVTAVDRLSEFSWFFEELYLTPPIPFMMTYEQMRNRGAVVSLDGHGADECFAGYGFDMVAALVDAGLNPFKIKSVMDARYGATDQKQMQFRLPSKMSFWSRYHYNRLKSRLCTGVQSETLHPVLNEMDNLTKVLYHSAHETILPTLLRNYDRYSMASGVEIRMPFMDHRLVSLAFSLPWTSKVRNGYSKALIRSAVEDLLPFPVAYRKTKIGFNAPVVDWIRGPLQEFFLDTTHSAWFNTSELVNQQMCKERLHNLLENPEPMFAQGEACWTAFAPFFWEMAFVRGMGCPSSCE